MIYPIGKFIMATELVIDSSVKSRDILFRKPLREIIKKAWSELNDNKSYKKLVHQVDSDLDIYKFGLEGYQWEAKMTEFLASLHHFWNNGKVKYLRKVLGSIIDVLGSLVNAASPAIKGALDSLKELAELICRALDGPEIGSQPLD